MRELDFTIRRATALDAPVCGPICFAAFDAISTAHNFPCDFPAPEMCIGVLSSLFTHPKFYSVVAEDNGRLLGSNCLDERAIIAGVGPITVDPGIQNRGVGRGLMQAALERADAIGASGVRLVQAGYHNRSLSLYASLGFDIREPLSCMQGRTAQRSLPGCEVRPAQSATCLSVINSRDKYTASTAPWNWPKASNEATPKWWSGEAASPATPRA